MALRFRKNYFWMLPLLLFLCISSAAAQTLTDRTDAIAKQLMCPVCAGQSVAESNSDLARDMRKLIRTKIENGQSDKEIISWFRGKYGDTILAEPPMEGFNLVVWLLPFAVVVAGVVFGVGYVRSEK